MDHLDERDLTFMLYDWLGAERLTAKPHFSEHSRETFDAVLAVSTRLAASHFATHYKKSDRVEPTLDDGVVRVLPEIGEALRAAAETGLFAADFGTVVGGLQLPKLVQSAAMAHLMAANLATAAYVMLTQANARLLCSFGTPAQIETFALPQVEGRWFGTMCLSEPQAGSSLADITTRAVPDGENALGPRYRLTGTKMWISGGDQDVSENIVHLVLAKIPDPATGGLLPGVGGISLFVVPKHLPDGTRNDAVVAGLNHKMGYRGTSNCLLNFGEGTRYRPHDAPGAVGYRIGASGSGLALMFQMMNEARIAVGLGAAALAVRGYRQSLAYARERPQGRPLAVGTKDPSARPRSIIEHPDVRRMLLVQKAYAEGALALILYCARLIDEEVDGSEAERRRASALLGLLTPVAKSWPSEFGLMANDLAIQVHGGYGYTRDFDVEQLYRDNRLNPIHEGTHGIQAIDLLGRKILRDREGALAALGGEIEATVAAMDSGDTADLAAMLRGGWSDVGTAVAVLAKQNDPAEALYNASAFLSAFGHIVVGWLWLDQVRALQMGRPSGGSDERDAFARGKRRACRYFLEVEVPKARQQLSFVASLNAIAGSMPLDEF